jgi:tRNA(fMet)-specific endonuclease VapC
VRYLLDTNAVIGLLNHNPPSVRQYLRTALEKKAEVYISSIVLFELWYGVARSKRQQENEQRLRIFLSGEIGVLSFEAEDAAIAGELRANLESAGTPIGPFDLLIAAQAIRHEMTLVTANLAEFRRISGLAWENWAD